MRLYKFSALLPYPVRRPQSKYAEESIKADYQVERSAGAVPAASVRTEKAAQRAVSAHETERSNRSCYQAAG